MENTTNNLVKTQPAPANNSAKVADVKKEPTVDIDSLRTLKRNVPILKTWRIFFPYFFGFLYALLLLVFTAGVVMVPMISNTLYVGEEATAPITSWVASIGMGETFKDLVSVFDIVMYYVKEMGGGIDFLVLAPLVPVAILAIFLVIEVIWFVIKFIHAFLALLTCGMRKHKIIDNFYFKHTKQYYTNGFLNWDFAFIVSVIINGGFWALMNFKIPGLAKFDVISNSPDAMFNTGTIAFLGIAGALLLFRLIYRLSVMLLSHKVKKSYVEKVNYRALKKACKVTVTK